MVLLTEHVKIMFNNIFTGWEVLALVAGEAGPGKFNSELLQGLGLRQGGREVVPDGDGPNEEREFVIVCLK